MLDNRELPLEKLTRIVLGPDFPTGGVILNTPEEIRQIYATGQGSIKLRGTYEPDPDKANFVLITSIPYGIEKDPLVQRIGELIGKGQVPQLTNVKDLSTDDIRISLELRPGSNADAALAYLFKNTPLQSNVNVNLTCLLPAAGAEVAVPARLDLKSILQHFLDFRLEVVTRRLRHELANLLNRIHILEGFAIVFNNLDEAIRIIRNSYGKADAAPKLLARFQLSERPPGQNAVLETKLYRLGKLGDQGHPRRTREETGAAARPRSSAACLTTSPPAGRSSGASSRRSASRTAMRLPNPDRRPRRADRIPRGRLHR